MDWPARIRAEGCCPVCTKDLEPDGWCYECRRYVPIQEAEEEASDPPSSLEV